MADMYSGGGLALVMGPVGRGFAVTAGPGDLPNDTRAIWCNAAGTLTLALADDGTVITMTVAAAQMLWIRAKKITACPAGTIGFY